MVRKKSREKKKSDPLKLSCLGESRKRIIRKITNIFKVLNTSKNSPKLFKFLSKEEKNLLKYMLSDENSIASEDEENSSDDETDSENSFGENDDSCLINASKKVSLN